VASPYREERVREFCQQRVALRVPEIESDGSEISHRRCERPAWMRCARCGRPLCRSHRPAPDRRCRACESEFDRSLARDLRDALLLSPRHRRVRVALCLSLLAASGVPLWLAVELDPSSAFPFWVAFALYSCMYALALQLAEPLKEDGSARRVRSEARKKFLRQGSGT
jgi:hypothetical protein